jgi:predicted Zn-dependent protease
MVLAEKGMPPMRSLPLVLVVIVLSLSLQRCGVSDTVADWIVSDSAEVAMGTDFYEQIVESSEYTVLDTTAGEENRKLTRYIQKIGRGIVNSLDEDSRPENEHLEYVFTVIDEDTTVNAFALPGGYVFIYTGLIKAAETEDEIAGVMAHEVGHITQRHGINRMVEQAGIQYVKRIVLGDDTSLVVDALQALLFLRYSRADEYEADSCAVEYLAMSGYNPKGMRSFLQKLAENGGWQFEPLSTHPSGENRISALDSLLLDQPGDVLQRPRDGKDVPSRWQ